MLAQYLEIKGDHPDHLLFYRMGDFYELFFADAEVAADALDIVLTKRGTHDGDPVPMCGVPVHACDQYLERLIRKGFRVAICEQLEDPADARKRGSKAVVRRNVVRVVTPGTLTEDRLLDPRESNFLAALAAAGAEFALAWLDLSTGEFAVETAAADALPSELARLHPRELLVPEPLLPRAELFETLGAWKPALAVLPAAPFDSATAERTLLRVFEVATLESFGGLSRAETAAAGALIDYVDRTQKGRLPRLSPPTRIDDGAIVAIDAATRRNLEITRSLAGGRAGSLLAAIDRTLTGAGARLLAARLAAPLTDPAAIAGRHDDVAFLVDRADLRARARESLRRCPDLERALSRLLLGRGGPRDLAALRDGLARAGELRAALDGAAPPAQTAAAARALGRFEDFVGLLAGALGPDLPHAAGDGGFVAPGHLPKLDRLRGAREERRRQILDLQAKYAEQTGIPRLKVRYNHVLGYFVEVTGAAADRLRRDDRFAHRQTMASAARFSTAELADLERALVDAADRALRLELRVFDDLVVETRRRADDIARAARALAELDVAAALAETAAALGHVRPSVDDSLAFEVAGGRHPVVEAALAAAGEEPFVPNDCDLSAARLWLLTGPNMAGKSTFLRQNALITVLAQTGAFVPAQRARIGVVDRLFSRVGAADDLARGRSTFLVEMVETAAILHRAGPRSLVILDEIGRGTATYDGLSLAWAVIEHLHDANRSRALFATHYHELTALARRLDGLANYTVRVKDWQGRVVFLHSVAPGAAEASYGIHVARIAGLPTPVLARAGEVLRTLEAGAPASAAARLADDLPLFAAPAPAMAPTPPPEAPVLALLADVLPDDLTPRDALHLVYRLKGLAAQPLP